jgi:hypothetical protein
MKLYTSKKTLTNMIIAAIVILAFVFFIRYFYDGTEPFKSTIDNKSYKVRAGENSQLKADLLAFINLKLNILVDSLSKESRYSGNVPVQRLIENWNRGVSIKEIGYLESDAAYVINKQDMSFCLQDSPEPGARVKTTSFADTNLITYVAIHELAHIMSRETGHGSEFVENFQFLLDYSKNISYKNPFTGKTEPLYSPYTKVPNTADNFCGVKLINSIN